MCLVFGVEVNIAASSHLMKTNARLSSRLTVSLCWVILDVRRRQSREAQSRKKKQQLPDSHLPCASAATFASATRKQRERETAQRHTPSTQLIYMQRLQHWLLVCTLDDSTLISLQYTSGWLHPSCICTAVCPQTVFEGVKAAKKKWHHKHKQDTFLWGSGFCSWSNLFHHTF